MALTRAPCQLSKFPHCTLSFNPLILAETGQAGSRQAPRAPDPPARSNSASPEGQSLPLQARTYDVSFSIVGTCTTQESQAKEMGGWAPHTALPPKGPQTWLQRTGCVTQTGLLLAPGPSVSGVRGVTGKGQSSRRWEPSRATDAHILQPTSGRKAGYLCPPDLCRSQEV